MWYSGVLAIHVSTGAICSSTKLTTVTPTYTSTAVFSHGSRPIQLSSPNTARRSSLFCIWYNSYFV